MNIIEANACDTGPSFYQQLEQDLLAIHTGDWITDLSNCGALIFQNLKDVNWVGFYLFRGNKLRLGPFQGRVACTHIEVGRGVCGQSAQQRKPLLVSDVHEFPGHISCDSRSRSEVVIPMIHEGHLLGVLDLDSPSLNRFSIEDVNGLERLVSSLLKVIGRSLKQEIVDASCEKTGKINYSLS